MAVDMSNLSDLQRRNLAAIRIKRAQMRNQFGKHIQIVDTDDEVLARNEPIAIPASALMTDKQIVIRMDNILERPNGSLELISDKRNQPLADNLEDVLTALEYTADMMEAQTKRDTKERLVAQQEFVVPEGYKLVKIEDDPKAEGVQELPEIPAISANDLGVQIPRESKLSDKEALDELLA